MIWARFFYRGISYVTKDGWIKSYVEMKFHGKKLRKMEVARNLSSTKQNQIVDFLWMLDATQ